MKTIRALEVNCPLFEREGDPRLPSPRLWDLADQIVGAEKGASSWTLMHRFNLCHDLLEGVEDDEEALALLFAWLRYSATRQLDWQRHYNTQPRELSRARSGSPSGWPASGDGNRRATPLAPGQEVGRGCASCSRRLAAGATASRSVTRSSISCTATT